MTITTDNFRLFRKGGRLFVADSDNGSEPQPVNAVWARPVTGRGREVSLLNEKKEEVLMLQDLSSLDTQSREAVDAALAQRYVIPRITRVVDVLVNSGSYFLSVETDRGPRRFAIRSPRRNIKWVTDDRLLIQDTMGVRYEIESADALDPRSRARLEEVI